MQKKHILILLIITTTVLSQDLTDKAADVLKGLVGGSRGKLADLTRNFEKSRDLQLDALNPIIQSRIELARECARRRQKLDSVKKEQVENENYIDWLGKKISNNNERIESISSGRCEGAK
jgi:hypothetical protein